LEILIVGSVDDFPDRFGGEIRAVQNIQLFSRAFGNSNITDGCFTQGIDCPQKVRINSSEIILIIFKLGKLILNPGNVVGNFIARNEAGATVPRRSNAESEAWDFWLHRLALIDWSGALLGGLLSIGFATVILVAARRFRS